mgnify:CR=1 FL=1
MSEKHSDLIKQINISDIDDPRGSLCVLEQGYNIPFPIKRVYYLFHTQKSFSRGCHAHKNLRQIAVAVSGKCRMVLDNGHERDDIWLDDPTKGILIESLIWREMHDFTPDCVLLVLASELYDENDYIRDYEEFLKEAGVEPK